MANSYCMRMIWSCSWWCVSRIADDCVDEFLFLHSEKCFRITFIRNVNTVIFEYRLGQHLLEEKSAIKDLVVLFNPKFLFEHQMDKVLTSTPKMLGFLLKHVSSFSDGRTFFALYYALLYSRLNSFVFWPERMEWSFGIIIIAMFRKFFVGLALLLRGIKLFYILSSRAQLRIDSKLVETAH